MIKVLPINNCKECPKFNEEIPYYECLASDTRCYEKDDDWEDYLEQYCPLIYLETIIDEAFEKGKEYSMMQENIRTQVKLSTEPTQWFTAQEFLEKLENLKGGE